MKLDKEASPGTPGAGYQDTNDRDIVAKQTEGVAESEAFNDESIDARAVRFVTLLPGTGGPDDSGDEAVPADYDPTGHARQDVERDDSAIPPKIGPTPTDLSPTENPPG
jgi:hypothetical protein